MHEPIALQLGTKGFNLVLSTPAICDFEQAAGKGIFKMDVPPSFSDLAILIWAAARRQAKGKITVEYVQEALDPADYGKALEAASRLIRIGLGLKDEAEAEPVTGVAHPLVSAGS